MGLDRFNGLAGLAFGARGQVDARRAMLGELDDCLFAETGISYTGQRLSAENAKVRTSSNQNDFALQAGDVAFRLER